MGYRGRGRKRDSPQRTQRDAEKEEEEEEEEREFDEGEEKKHGLLGIMPGLRWSIPGVAIVRIHWFLLFFFLCVSLRSPR
ncbi:MAG: hypothetical protein NTV86_16940 [Planctomycetota bacterium]|nr:hypothetical protein [Planctomycetota bacterium]